jgi:hypothetical protein
MRVNPAAGGKKISMSTVFALRNDPHPPQFANWGTFPKGKAFFILFYIVYRQKSLVFYTEIC